MEPTVRHSRVAASSVSGGAGGKTIVTMSELYTGWFEVRGMEGAPNSTVSFYVSTTQGVESEFSMTDRFTFGASGKGDFVMRFSCASRLNPTRGEHATTRNHALPHETTRNRNQPLETAMNRSKPHRRCASYVSA